MAKIKVQITLDEELVARIDSYADDNYMSRSGLISVATAQFLNQQEAVSAVKSMSLAMRKIADTGTLDEASMKELEDFERICQYLIPAKS